MQSVPALPLVLALLATLLAVLHAGASTWWVLRQPKGSGALHGPWAAIREGARAFMRTQYGVIAAVGAVLFGVLLLVPGFGAPTAFGFLAGGLCSALAGLAGMSVSVEANVRVAEAARTSGVTRALLIASRAGSVTGMLVGGLAVGVVALAYLMLAPGEGGGTVGAGPLAGLGFGASLISIFARLGGGIFTKAADVGADLAGKLEQGIPEDDPRNPAVIADNVGDNVGDCAGMAADLFESYAVTLVAAMVVGGAVEGGGVFAQVYPPALGGVALLAGMIGIQVVPVAGEAAGRHPLLAMSGAVAVTIVLALAGFWALGPAWIPPGLPWSSAALLGCTLVGLGVGVGLVATTDYYTGTSFPPVRDLAAASRSGHATNVIRGLALGMRSPWVPTLVVALGIVGAHALAGVYGIAVAAVALLSLTPIVVSIDAYGPVADNAGGIVEMSGLGEEVREATDVLDALGNTTKAVTRTFAIGSAGLAALALFVAFELELGPGVRHTGFALDDPWVLAGLLTGALLPFVFSGLALDAVGRAAAGIVEEVRRQFREHPGILTGEESPDHGRAVSGLTRVAIREMLLPGSLPIAVPVLVAFVWAPLAPPGSAPLLMGGILMGAVAAGLILAVLLSTAGAAWDNAKKLIESGAFGGKGSPAHEAAITGDTVGDPCKDTAGPAINPLSKVLNLVTLLLVPFLLGGGGT